MNLGFYVRSLTDESALKLSVESIEKGKESSVDDASIFYDVVGFTPLFFPCGLFNSTDLWNFSGKLVVFSIDCLKNVQNIVSDIETYYCYGWQKESVLDILRIDANIITKTEKDEKELYRLTGKKSLGSLDNNDLLDLIG